MHAFADDALGALDAVGLVTALRAGRLSRREVVAAAIERTRQLDTVLDAVATERYVPEVRVQRASKGRSRGSPVSWVSRRRTQSLLRRAWARLLDLPPRSGRSQARARGCDLDLPPPTTLRKLSLGGVGLVTAVLSPSHARV